MSSSSPPLLIVISAPSGAGKTTLCQRLLRDFAPRLVLSISSTTRAPRGGERDGVDYHFLEPVEFRQRIHAGEFAEWAEVHAHFYGTSKKTIESAFSSGKSVLLDIDVQGAASLRQAYPTQTYSVFISPPSIAVLEARLRARGTDSESVIQRRLLNAQTEMREAPHFHAVVVNDDLEAAYLSLRSLVQSRLLGRACREKGDFP